MCNSSYLAAELSPLLLYGRCKMELLEYLFVFCEHSLYSKPGRNQVNQQRTGVFKQSWTSSYSISTGYSFNICVFSWRQDCYCKVWYCKLCFSWDFDCIRLEFYGQCNLKSDSFSLEDVNFLDFFLSTNKIYNFKACQSEIFTLSKKLLQKGKGLINTEWERAEVLLALSCRCLKFWICLTVFYCEEYFMYTVCFGAAKSWVVRGNK